MTHVRYVITYYIKCVKTSWTYSTGNLVLHQIIGYLRVGIKGRLQGKYILTSSKSIKADFEEVIVNVKFDTELRKNRTNLLSSDSKRQSSKLHQKNCEIEGLVIGSVDVVTFA